MCIAEAMAAEGMRVDGDDLIVTTGGQQVIDLVTKVLIDPGTWSSPRRPTYPGAVPVFSSYEADVVQVDMDADGMRIDLLEETLDRLEREGRRPKFVYTVPSFQNPAGVTMSLPRRRRLVEVARERELLVLEDNPYGLLRFEGPAPETLYSLDGGVYVMYLGTFSKMLSPGIRLGWVAAPAPVLEKINLGKQAADLCTSTLSPADGAGLLRAGRWRDYVPRWWTSTAGGATPCSSPGGALPAAGGMDTAGRRAVHLGDAARLHRHHRPAGPGAPRERGLRARRGRLPGRPRPQLAAAQLLRSRPRRDPRGHPPHRRGGDRAGGALRDAHRRAAARGRSRPARDETSGQGARVLPLPSRGDRALRARRT